MKRNAFSVAGRNTAVRVIFAVLLGCFFMPLPSCASFSRQPEAQTAIASWYGSEFHGKPTSSGEPFDMYGYTCAHREYPLGSTVKVTHASSGRSVYCLVNDRGPFVPGRDIDLSYAAARELGIVHPGTAPVFIEYAGSDAAFARRVGYPSRGSTLTVQVGSFRDRTNAERLRESLSARYDGIRIHEIDHGGVTYYRVRVGRFADRTQAAALADTLRAEGYPALIVRHDENI